MASPHLSTAPRPCPHRAEAQERFVCSHISRSLSAFPPVVFRRCGVIGEAESAGATIVRPAAVQPWGGTSGAFADPEGYVWEVAYNPNWTIADDGSVEM
jgi:hypothetical protein